MDTVNFHLQPNNQPHFVVSKITTQQKNRNRANIFVNQKYELSLTITQVIALNIKIGSELSPEELDNLRAESEFGKLYMRALEYISLRPRSEREMINYLHRKKISVPVSQRVISKLLDNNYINDVKTAEAWINNRFITKGISKRKLRIELMKKGISSNVIDEVINNNERNDRTEIKKIIDRKRNRYSNTDKLILYLVRQGFDYNLAKSTVENSI